MPEITLAQRKSYAQSFSTEENEQPTYFSSASFWVASCPASFPGFSFLTCS